MKPGAAFFPYRWTGNLFQQRCGFIEGSWGYHWWAMSKVAAEMRQLKIRNKKRDFFGIWIYIENLENLIATESRMPVA